MRPETTELAEFILESAYLGLEKKREKYNGFVQGCSEISRNMMNLLSRLGEVKRALIKKPNGDWFENTATNDLVNYHFFIIFEGKVFDPFTSSAPLDVKKYLSFFSDYSLYVGCQNGDSYEYSPIEKFCRE